MLLNQYFSFKTSNKVKPIFFSFGKRLLFFLLTFFCSSLIGQNVKFRTLSTDDGLSNNSVNDIISDKDGVLWIATWDGLSLYDGNNFIVYKHAQGNPTSISGNVISKLIKDGDDKMWVLTDNNSVGMHLGNGVFKNYSFEHQPTELKLSDEGDLIIEIDTLETLLYKEDHFIKIPLEKSKQKKSSPLNNILLSKFPELFINESMRDSNGNIWYATQNNGLYIIRNNSSNINNGNVEHYEYDLYFKYSFTSNEIEKLYEDEFDNVWLGHKDGGLSMAYQESEHIGAVFPHPVKFPHLPNETIRAVTKDFRENTWLGYYTQGLFYYSDETKCYLKYNFPKISENQDWNRVRSLFTSSDGSIWAGTYAGLLRIRDHENMYYSAADFDNLPNNRNYSIVEDHKKKLWIACWGGLAKFDLKTGKFQSFDGQDELMGLRIRKVYIFEDEIILSVENGGVVILNSNTGNVSKINTENGILGNNIFNAIKDGKTGYYWIASQGGISVYDSKKGLIANITEKDGLPSHLVYSLILNGDKIWISTTKGIAAINRDNFHVSSLNPGEGWQAAEFSEGAYYEDLKGDLYFGGINGLNYFSPAAIDFVKELPNIKVNIDGKNDFSNEITKDYWNNSIKLDITPISFTKNTNNRILYKLSGYDEEWNIFDKTQVYYEDLPYGRYNLTVRSSLDPNVDAGTSINIIVEKPFYRSLWLVSLFLVLLTFSLTYWVALRNKNIVKNREMLEQKIIKRTQIINDQKQNLVETNYKLDEKNKEVSKQKQQLLNLYHQLKNEDFEIDKFKMFVLSEFKEPISKIIGSSSKLEDQPEIKKELSKQSGKLLNLLMEWDYLGHIKEVGGVKKSIIKLRSTIKLLVEDLRIQTSKSKLHLDYTLDLTDALVEMDVLRFKLLFKYLFNVIIKYTEANNSLKIVIKNDKEVLFIKITSNSKVLTDNFFNIEHYSPYFKAASTLITAMDGYLTVDQQKTLSLILELPIKLIDFKGNKVEHVSWKHLGLHKKSQTNTNNILVYCSKYDFLPAEQLLEDPSNTLLFESSIEETLSAIKHINVHGLVIYDSPITEGLIQLFNTIKNNVGNIPLPIIYISEEINYFLREQTIELGVDAVIQLPASKVFIQKKFIKLIALRREYLNDKSTKQRLFNLPFSDGNRMLSSNEKLIKKALDLIHKNMDDSSFNVEKLTNMLFVSKIKCYRTFKEVLQKSPLDVIIDLRLQKAEHLLKNKALNISEISMECGFNDPKYFSRLFKKNFKCSPKQYRKGQE